MTQAERIDRPRDVAALIERPGRVILSGVPDGFDALVLADLIKARAQSGARAAIAFVARDGQRLAALLDAFQFFAPDIETIAFPAWDCLPYDRVSPAAEVSAERLSALARLAQCDPTRPALLATTVNAAMQRTLPRSVVSETMLSLKPGGIVDTDDLIVWFNKNGFERVSTVREAGEFAVRGGIIDLFPPGAALPLRLDFFGDTLESIRSFAPDTQRTEGQLKSFDLVPTSEVLLDESAIRRFRAGYLETFGASTRSDPVYEAVSAGRRHQGLEHWLPLFQPELETIFDHFGADVPIIFDPLADEARQERQTLIEDYYDARRRHLEDPEASGTPYKPVPPERFFLSDAQWADQLAGRAVADLTPFEVETGSDGRIVHRLDGRQGRNFAAERADQSANVFDAVVGHIRERRGQGAQVLVTTFTEGGRDRMVDMLHDHGLENARAIDRWADADARRDVSCAALGIETGFEAPGLVVISEQDVLGDRYVRHRRKTKRPADFLTELTALSEGDLIVHVDHGIGRFSGLKTVEALGIPHDCLEIHYAGGDKLFLPVENIELLSRYGSDETGATLDRLGGGGWQARKAKLKSRIREMADELIKVAAERSLRQAPVIGLPEGLYDEFSARFPYDETDDQRDAIDATLDDLGQGRPMDRLICGDVGFGKTEVALRAAFITAATGRQVAVVVPTTLLARQHYETFRERFFGIPMTVAQASRLVSTKDLNKVKAGLASGEIDIVIGTHALLGKSIEFKNLGLIVVDEEQHFGVAHKERLKSLKSDVHVLTLSATPIPRTLQLAMTGIRELSIIATPPVDRLSVRTYVTPFDALVLREAILREHYRAGQTFFVCPRLSDIDEMRTFLAETVPEVKVAVAHGQLAANELEDVMTAFYDGKYDVLLSTAIVESGLDIPTANTLIVYRAHMFGLAQLHQLRGRVGRSKVRAYAYFTTPANRQLTPQAEKRLRILQSLDSLGAGFMLASHDLDIRGAGNLLGAEQSGHIKEVGFELYQQMLEEAVASLKDGDGEEVDGQWSPQINLGTPVMIPDSYVADLDIRLGLYRRLGQLEEEAEIEDFAAELADRFGNPPAEVGELLEIMRIKLLCRRAGVDRVEAGPKGLVVGLRGDRFANPEGLIEMISKEGSKAKVRSDNRIVLNRDWPTTERRIAGTRSVLREMAALVDNA